MFWFYNSNSNKEADSIQYVHVNKYHYSIVIHVSLFYYAACKFSYKSYKLWDSFNSLYFLLLLFLFVPLMGWSNLLVFWFYNSNNSNNKEDDNIQYMHVDKYHYSIMMHVSLGYVPQFNILRFFFFSLFAVDSVKLLTSVLIL